MNAYTLVWGNTNQNLQFKKSRTTGALTTIPFHEFSKDKFSPKYTLYGDLISGWVLIQPLQVALEQEEDGTYILSDELFDEYGEGETLEEARQDYVANLITYYEILSERASRPENQRLFARIQRYLVKLD